MADADTEFTDILGDVFDIRDVIARFEALVAIKDTEEFSDEEKTELDDMTAFLDEVKGTGGDEQWAGDWYPVTFIRESHFKDYAEELAEEIGAIKRDMGWPYQYIDWDAASEALKQDYSSVDINGDTYWYR